MTMALFLYFFVTFCLSTLGSQNFQKCADPKCQDPIGEAEAILTYNANTEGKVSFKIGDKVVLYSKTNGALWGVEVGGKRGFAPKGVLKEKKTYHKDLKHEVPMKLVEGDEGESDDPLKKSGQPEISKPYIIDGAVIYTNSTEDLDMESINPTSSVQVQSTANENLEVTPTKLNTDYHGISPHTNIGSGENEVQENFNERTGEGTKDINELKVLEEAIGGKDFKPFPFELGVQGNEKEESENDLEESDEDLGEEEEEEDEEEEEEDETEEINEKEDNEDETLMEKGEANYKEEKILSELNHEQLDSGEKVVVASQTAGSDGDNINNTSSILSTVDNISNKATLEDNFVDNSGLPKIDLTSQNEHSEQNDIEISNITKDSKDSVKTEETVRNIRSEESEGTVGSEETNRKEQELLGIRERTENQGAVGSGMAESVETEGSAVTEGDGGIEKVEGTKKTEDITKTVSYENTENDPRSSDNPMMPSELFNGVKDKMKEQTLSESEEDHSGSVEQKEISLEKGELESPSTTNEFTSPPPSSLSPDEKLGDQITSEESSVETMIDNLKNVENDVSEIPHNAYEATDNIHEAETNSEEKVGSDYETIDHADQLLKVQGSCEAESPGCIPNGDLPEQLSPTLDAEEGWFTALTQLELPYLTWASMMEGHKSSFDTLVILMITGSSIVLFLLGYYYLEKYRRDGSLLAKISSLERELMVAVQEKFALNDELEKAKERLIGNGDFVASDQADVAQLRTELEECKIARSELEDQVMSLEKELETATEAGLELNKMMSELLSQQHGSDTKDLMQSVEHLQKQLDSQQTTISTMNHRLSAKTRENENLQSELNAASNKIVNLEEQLAKVKETFRNMQKEKLDVENDFKTKNMSIEKQLMETLESKSAESQRLQTELDSLQDILDETRKNLSEREGEVSVLRESLSQAECLTKGGDADVSLEALLDVGKLRVQVECLSKERDDLKEKLQGEEDARKLLEDHMKIVSEEVSTLRTKYEEADHGKAEAQTRLEILSNYFKEKETQLQKELGLQEAMYIQKEGDALTTIERIKAFQAEIESYKSQNEILKKEIIDQEKSMKSKIAMLEKEVHENWIVARQTERRLEESKREASQLRSRLTLSGRRLVGTIPGPEVGKSPDRELEYNGEMSASPAHLGEPQELQSSPMHFGHPASPPLLPPSGQQIAPGPFPGMPLFLPLGGPPMPFPMPPPPGNMFPEDLRPPPLGRMSSPPPVPHSSFSPYNNSPPMSPHGRPCRSPIHYEDSPSRFRQPLQSSNSFSYSSPYPPSKWDEPPRSSFRPLHRDSPREPKGSTISSGHSSESLDKGSRHSDRV